MELNENLYTDNYQSLDEWFELVNSGECVYPQIRIPYNDWLKEYIANIENKSYDEVKDLLRCLLRPINRKIDLDSYGSYLLYRESDNPEFNKMAEMLYMNEKYKRIEAGDDAWEGITWILELLPYSPYQAVLSLEGYSFAQKNLPDDRIIGIRQCIDIIYAKFIYIEKAIRILLNLKPVEFEWLIEELYHRIGYQTKWTQATRDGGKDIIASIKRTDGEEIVYIECKLYNTTELTNNYVKAFAYTVNDEKINRGVIFCTGYASSSLKKIDKRIQIITFENICVLLNAHLGSDWEDRLDRIIANKRIQYMK